MVRTTPKRALLHTVGHDPHHVFEYPVLTHATGTSSTRLQVNFPMPGHGQRRRGLSRRLRDTASHNQATRRGFRFIPPRRPRTMPAALIATTVSPINVDEGSAPVLGSPGDGRPGTGRDGVADPVVVVGPVVAVAVDVGPVVAVAVPVVVGVVVAEAVPVLVAVAVPVEVAVAVPVEVAVAVPVEVGVAVIVAVGEVLGSGSGMSPRSQPCFSYPLNRSRRGSPPMSGAAPVPQALTVTGSSVVP